MYLEIFGHSLKIEIHKVSPQVYWIRMGGGNLETCILHVPCPNDFSILKTTKVVSIFHMFLKKK